MKNVILIAAALMISSAAHASTFICDTVIPANIPDMGGYAAVITTASDDAKIGVGKLQHNGGFAQYIEVLMNQATVKVTHNGPTVIFTNKAEGFMLSMNYIRYQGEVGYSGTLNYTRKGFSKISEAVNCSIQ